MKKLITLGTMFIIIGCAAQGVIINKKSRNRFSVKDEVVFYDNKPLAKYQAKTYSLDGGELVEEYNLLLIDNNIPKKQVIGDLIDFISDRHQGAEVEVEINSDKHMFEL
jgi:hypothetical protein